MNDKKEYTRSAHYASLSTPPATPPPAAALAPVTKCDWQRTLLFAAVIVFAGLFVASPAFHGTWLWDDDQEITANGALRTASGLVDIWTPGKVGADYLPLKATILWVEYQIWGLDNTCYHIINAIWHVINALLVWALFSKLRIKWAWLGGLLFAIHPILVESVAWVSEQKNTISMIFMLLSAIYYVNYDEKGKGGSLAASLILFLCALLSKSAVVMLPFCFILYAWWKRGRISLRDIVNTSAFFVVAVIIAAVTVYYQHKNAIGAEIIPVGGLVSRTATAGLAIFFYLYKCLIPFDLIPIYPRWEVAQPSAWMFLPWPMMGVMLVWFWMYRKTWGRHMIFGLGFFLGNLVPVLGFITMSYMRITWVADHFVYISVVGVIGLVVAGASALYEKIPSKGQPWAAGIGAAALFLLALNANLYSDVFLNETNMWRYTLSKNKDAWQAHSRYGKVLLDSGNRDAAFYHIQQSNRLRPDLAETNNNMGVLLLQKGRGPEALPYFKEAVRLMPIGAFLVNYANALTQAGQGGEATQYYEKLLQNEPGNPILLTNYGVALLQGNRREDAIRVLRRALEINPNLQDARRNLEIAEKLQTGTGTPAIVNPGTTTLGIPTTQQMMQIPSIFLNK